jgi:hypothetical protein
MNLLPSCAKFVEILESQPPGTLRPVQGLLYLYLLCVQRCKEFFFFFSTLNVSITYHF